MFGAAAYGAETKGQDILGNLFNFHQAMERAKQQRTTGAALGDYLQSLSQPQAPYPGTPSKPTIGAQDPSAATRMFGPTAAGSVQTRDDTQEQPKQMSLDGLMQFLDKRGVTGEDAYATALQFEPWLAAQDKQKLGQMKFEIDMQKLLIANGFDASKAKNEAARISANRERTQSMYGKGGQKDKIQALNHTVQQLTVGRQKLAQQRDNLVNSAHNAGRMLTMQEQSTIQAINAKIQTVDSGMEAARSQQSLLMSGLNYGAQDGGLQPDNSASSADSVSNDVGDGGDGG